MLRRGISVGVAALICALLAPALPEAAGSAMSMVQKALRATERVEDYTATVAVTINSPDLNLPRRTAKVYFKRPDMVRVDSSGLMVIPRDALMLGNLGKHVERYATATFAGSGTIGGRPVRCIKLAPRDAGPGSGRVLVWIDSERYLLLKSEIWRGGARMIAVTFEHTRVNDRYWMPQRIVTEVAPGALTGKDEGGRIELTFSNYRVNSGLSDYIFEESE